jgi:hypothetical protein
MDKLEHYRKTIIEVLKEQASHRPKNYPDILIQLVVDKENDHYFLYHTGWKDMNRIHDCLFHVDIIDGKVWAQEDNTNVDIVTEIVERGVPKEDIVLGFHPPYKRKFTGFAVA